jgi:hypothetical protein
MTTPPDWPSGNHEWPPSTDQYHGPPTVPYQPLDDQLPEDRALAQMAIAEMAGLLRDIRVSVAANGGILAAITVGIALEATPAASALRVTPLGALTFAFGAGLALCWLTAAFLLIRASRPVLSRLSELRWVTGAPVDPRPGWLTLPPVGADPAEWTLNRAHLLLAAARLVRYRMQLADTWTYLTAGCFLAWTTCAILSTFSMR